ncbi:MAG: BON domain-containing protein [Paraburkholderia sp.]|jgi:hyperosmotically inducible protein|uniref:BON domain-containing protein n=1 Tax=Paraburkholderia sp. TaxID=1926495 RepID=UPI003978C556
MKSPNIVKVVSGVAAVAFVLHVNAQASDAAASPTAATAPASNPALAKQVRHALARTNGLDPTHIYVRVVNGAVRLAGSAKTEHQIDLAVKAAQDVSGVIAVKNDLSVRSGGQH